MFIFLNDKCIQIKYVGFCYFVVTILIPQIAHNIQVPIAIWERGYWHVDYKSKLIEIHDLCAYDVLVSTQEESCL